MFAEELKGFDGKVLIHCKGCSRVTYFMMAYLIKEHEFSLAEAEVFCKQLTYFSPLDNLLGEK